MGTAAVLACRPATPALLPVPDADALATALEAQHRIRGPRLTLFRWRYRGREGNLSGEGALRVDHEERARVDFLGAGSTTLQVAVMLGDSLHVRGKHPELAWPPAPLLWAMAGVFRPPGPSPSSAGRRADATILHYRTTEGDALRFEFGAGGRLRRVVYERRGHAEQDLTLQWSERWPEVPARADFRDLREFRAIRLEVTRSREHAPFDPALFRLPPR